MIVLVVLGILGVILAVGAIIVAVRDERRPLPTFALYDTRRPLP